MLLSEHGGGHQHCHLLTVHHCLEGGADSHLGLAVADIPADQPVHGFGFLHVLLYLFLSLHLVGGLNIGEGSLKLLLPDGIRGEGEAGHNLSGGIKCQQLLGDLFRSLSGSLFGSCPLLGAQPTQHRRSFAGSYVAADPVYLVGGDIELVASGVVQDQIFLFCVIATYGGDATKSANAVLDVHYIIAWNQFHEELLVRRWAFLGQSPFFDKAEEFSVGKQVGIVIHHPPFSQ